VEVPAALGKNIFMIRFGDEGPPAWGLSKELITSHLKEPACYEALHMTSKLAGSFEHGDEPSGIIKGWKFLAERILCSQEGPSCMELVNSDIAAGHIKRTVLCCHVLVASL
jgi:hypothetical protein